MAFETKFTTYLIADTAINISDLDDLMYDLDQDTKKDYKYETVNNDLVNWVDRVDSDNDAEILTEFAGKSCYMSFSTDLNKNLTKVNTKTNKDYIQKSIIQNEHESVLEHSTVSIYVKDISRVVTHELIRHRAGTAYSQLSGRYVRTKEIGYYFPEVLANSEHNIKARELFNKAFEQQEEIIDKLSQLYDIDNKDFATKKKLTSAFRRIIGNGQVTNILITANHRAWRHMIKLRTDESAEEEIRALFYDIFLKLSNKYTHIYADAHIENIGSTPKVTFRNFD